MFIVSSGHDREIVFTLDKGRDALNGDPDINSLREKQRKKLQEKGLPFLCLIISDFIYATSL